MSHIVVRSDYGLSRHVPYLPGEPPRDRHRRRHTHAMAHRETVAAWCEFRGVALLVVGSRHVDTRDCPEGWKWDFRVPGKFAQWRPFAGRLQYKTDLRSEVVYVAKVYDYEQLLAELEVWLGAKVGGEVRE